MNNTFGTRIRELRKRAGITQKELAKSVGKCKSFICNIEKGTRTTKLENIPALADALGVSIGELIGNDIDPSNPFIEYLPYLAQADPTTLRNIRAILGMPL